MVLPFNEKLLNHKLYVLVDGALAEGFYDKLSQIDKLRYKSLFTGTMDASSAAIGPILLELDTNVHAALIETLFSIQKEAQTPVWLKTEIQFTSLFNTLRELLYVEKEDGSQYLFRYYDHQCLPSFLSIVYKNPYYAYTMKKIQWAVWQQDKKGYQLYDKDNLESTS